ncbi:MAG: PIN domain-containing protein [Deltaproteobacteria bacterium]|nr:PIN domain-containing protein [Deltaproteobacteria bacterium]
MKIVLDTNVLLSGMMNPSCPPGRIVDFLRTGVLQLVIDDRIIAEYTDILHQKEAR